MKKLLCIFLTCLFVLCGCHETTYVDLNGTMPTVSTPSSPDTVPAPVTDPTLPPETETQASVSPVRPVSPPATQPLPTESTPSETVPPVSEADYSASALLLAINHYRLNAGLSPVAWDPELAVLALARAQEASILWSHSRPDGSDYSTILSHNSITGWTVHGENLLRTSALLDSAAIISMWSTSSDANSNLLNPAFQRLGIGIFQADNGYVYVAVLFLD